MNHLYFLCLGMLSSTCGHNCLFDKKSGFQLFRRVLLMFVFVLTVSLASLNALHLSLWVLCIIFALIALWLRPFRSSIENALEVFSLFVLVVCLRLCIELSSLLFCMILSRCFFFFFWFFFFFYRMDSFGHVEILENGELILSLFSFPLLVFCMILSY